MDNLNSILKSLIANELVDMHTCMPAILEKYHAPNRADVRPLLKYKPKRSKEPIELPLIQDVPIQELRYSQDAWIKLPIKEGTKVTLFFVEQSIDDYLETGDSVLPTDHRRFHLQDAFIVPGFFPSPDQVSPRSKASDLEIVNDKTSLILSNDSVKIQNGQGELIKVIQLLLARLQTMLVNDGSGGPWPLMESDKTAFKDLEDIVKKIGGIKEDAN